MALSVRTGIDLVSSDRVADLVRTVGDPFLQRTWTDAELDDCKGDIDRLAARWAAKEATIKALHAKIADVPLTDIRVTTGDHGDPQLHLSGVAAAMADDSALTSWSVSLTHDGGFAAAMVIGIAES